MAVNADKKRNALIAIIICSSVMMFRSCNGTLVKEEKKGVVIEPPKFEEIQHEDICLPQADPEVLKEMEVKYVDGYSVTDQTEIVKGGK